MSSPTNIQFAAEAHAPPPPTAPSARWFCKACNRNADPSRVHPLKACSRCRLVRYCSRDCQRRDFANHKAECKRFETLQCNLRQSTNSFKAYVDTRIDNQPHNLFEEARGHFYDMPQTREHCRKLAEMGHELEDLAITYPVMPLLTKSLASRLELLRLNADDDMGMRDLVPFTLLRLRRDGHCVAFIDHWFRIMNGSLNALAQHERSKRGEWLYGKADPHDDVLTNSGMRLGNAPIPQMIALVIVKLRLIADNKDEQRLREQERLVEAYLDAVHQLNESLLPALINPAPLRERPAPVLKKLGGPSETYFTLLSCYELFVAVPGAVDRLIRRFGPNPQYDCDMDMW